MVTTTGLLIAGLVTSIAGTGVAAYSAIQAGKAQQSISNYNAAVSDQSALDTARDGRIAANAARANNERIKARQRALYAKAGVSIGTGSPLMVQVAQAGELEMGALEQEQQANAQAAKLRQQAVLDRMGGSAARSAGTLNAVSTVLNGSGQAFDIGSKYVAAGGKFGFGKG